MGRFRMPLLIMGAVLAVLAGSALAQNGPDHDGEGDVGREECTKNTSDALTRLQELLNEGEDVEDGIAAIENCGTDEEIENENEEEVEDADTEEVENGDGEVNDNGDGGNGHEACSEATEHALEVLNELLDRGEPVEESIAAIEACGTGADEQNGPPDGEPPVDVQQGPPDDVPQGPPDGVPQGPPDGVPPDDVPQGPPDGVPPEDVPQGPPDGVPPEEPNGS